MLGPNTPLFNLHPTATVGITDEERPFVEDYKKLRGNHWVEDDIDKELPVDETNWPKLKPAIQIMLTHILAFFLHADSIVGDMADVIMESINNSFLKLFLGYQIGNEGVHQLCYGKLMETFFGTDLPQLNKLMNKESLNGSDAYRKKLEWCEKWVEGEDVNPTERLVAFGVSEGIMFASAFAGIFWVRSLQGKERAHLPGFFLANEIIMQDEGMHFRYSARLYRALSRKDKIPVETIYRIVDEAVQTEKQFIEEAIPDTLRGMCKEDMFRYVQWVADYFLKLLGVPPKYGVNRCPFDFMNRLWLPGRNNPFERKGSEYGKHVSNGGSSITYSPSVEPRRKQLSFSSSSFPVSLRCSNESGEDNDDSSSSSSSEEGSLKTAKERHKAILESEGKTSSHLSGSFGSVDMSIDF